MTNPRPAPSPFFECKHLKPCCLENAQYLVLIEELQKALEWIAVYYQDNTNNKATLEAIGQCALKALTRSRRVIGETK